MYINWYKTIRASFEDILPPEQERLGFRDIFQKLTENDLLMLQQTYSFSDFFKPGGEGAAFIDSKTGHIVKITEEDEELTNAVQIMSNGSEFFVPVFNAFVLPDSGVFVIEEGYADELSAQEYQYIKYIHNDMVSIEFSNEMFSPYYKQKLQDQMKYSTRFSLDIQAFSVLFDKYINLIKGISKSGFDVSDTHEDNIGWYEGRLVRFDFGYM